MATVVTILVYAGNMAPSNMNLFAPDAIGISEIDSSEEDSPGKGNPASREISGKVEKESSEESSSGKGSSLKKKLPEKYAGRQNMLRFGFKVVAGAVLGWVLTRTNARTGILATSTIFLAAQVWAMLVTGPWYLIAFGIYGAGELIGVYSPNYIVSASRTNDLRRNMAFATMLMVPAAPAGYLYGAIVDSVKQHELTAWGMNSVALGFRLSFLTCGLLILSGIVVAVIFLPKQPRAPHDLMPLRDDS